MNVLFKFLILLHFPSIAVPGQCEKPTVTDVSIESMTVEWDEPEYDGGSPVTGYWLERKETTSKRWTRVNREPIRIRTLGVSHIVTGLMEGAIYQFRVIAINAAGCGPPSVPSDPVPCRDPIGMSGFSSFLHFIFLLLHFGGPFIFTDSCIYYTSFVFFFSTAPPGPPTPKVTDCTKSTVDLEWIPPLVDGGSKITGYFVEYKEEGQEEWEKVCDTHTHTHTHTHIYIYSIYTQYI